MLQNQKETLLDKIIPWIGSLIIFPFVLFFIFNKGNFNFLDYFNLLVHEGGHGVFKIFGLKFIHALGGTLMQIIIPGMFVVFYYIKKKKLGFQFFMLLMGENLINISVYASDAQKRALPLLGGNKVYHDWNYLLTATNILEYDFVVGYIFYFLGVISFIVALLAPLFIVLNQKTEIDLPL